MRRLHFLWMLVLGLDGLALACHSSETSSTSSVNGIAGVVLDTDTGAGIANVLVNLNSNTMTLSTTTNAQGGFAFAQVPEAVVLSFYGNGYTSLSLSIYATNSNHLQVKLRATELSQNVRLPAAGEDPVVLTIDHQAASSMFPDPITSSLQIAAADLVDSSGMPVSGNVQVSMTFVGPLDDRSTAPSLWATVNHNIMALTSLGMTYVQVVQNGNLLAVNANQSLTWTISGPSSLFGNLLQSVADLDMNVRTPSNVNNLMYFLDENTAMWQPTDVPLTIAQSGNNLLLSAQLPHLSHWNADTGQQVVGGCTMGDVIDQCGDPVSGFAGGLFISSQYVGQNASMYLPFKTNTSGEFCIELEELAALNNASYPLNSVFGPYTVAFSDQNPNDVQVDVGSATAASVTFPCPFIQNQPACWNNDNWTALNTVSDGSYPIYVSLNQSNPSCMAGNNSSNQPNAFSQCFYENSDGTPNNTPTSFTINGCHLCSPNNTFLVSSNKSYCKKYYGVASPTTNATYCAQLPVLQVVIPGKQCCSARTAGSICNTTSDCCSSDLVCIDHVCTTSTINSNTCCTPLPLNAACTTTAQCCNANYSCVQASASSPNTVCCKPLTLGDSCEPATGCCNPNYSCLDFQCVPPTDPGYVGI